jgi:hypothetical protein
MPLQFKSEKDLVSFVVDGKLPEWQRKLFKKNAEAVKVHSQGHIFYKLDRLFPNEHPESKFHRILSFESITEASFGRAANNINRIFRNSSYTVEASDSTIQDANDHRYDGQNFFTWFLDEWVKYALKTDPNSMIVIYPPEYVDATGKKPCVFVESCFFKKLTDDAFVFISEAESEIEYELKDTQVCSEVFYDQSINRKNVREAQKNTFTPVIEHKIIRAVYHAFFKGFGFVRVEQLPDGQGYEVTEYPFDPDFNPYTDVGGEKGQNDVNKSFLHPFVPFGNLALLQHSQHTAVNFTFSFPRMSEIQTPCDSEGCQDGRIVCENEIEATQWGGDSKPCGKCGGTGFTRNQTPYKVYVKNYDPQGAGGADDAKYLEVDDVKYYSPDTAILTYSKDEWKNYLEMAEVAVYINQRVKTGNTPSAESKNIDRDDMFSFLARVAQAFFSRLRFALQAQENFTVPSPTQVSVETPYSFAILTEAEAFEALKGILSSDVPVMLKASQVEGFINKFVSQSSPIRRFVDVLKIVDKLLWYTNNEISGFKANNIVSQERYATHVFAFPVLQDMYFEDKNLFLEDTKTVADKLTERLKEFMPVKQQDLKTKLLGEPPVNE